MDLKKLTLVSLAAAALSCSGLKSQKQRNEDFVNMYHSNSFYTLSLLELNENFPREDYSVSKGSNFRYCVEAISPDEPQLEKLKANAQERVEADGRENLYNLAVDPVFTLDNNRYCVYTTFYSAKKRKEQSN